MLCRYLSRNSKNMSSSEGVRRKHRIRPVVMAVICMLLAVIMYMLYFFNYIPHPSYSNEDFGIQRYISDFDMDNDGIDDETDILDSVRQYIATQPKYKSKYYDGGYPDDNYGVCTDVVVFGLKGAGYDLMELVDEDIALHSSDYDIESPDKNIDFRRVRNLKIYFKNNALSLTTDIYDISQWQGGDIVVFEKHIGVVSDKRNKNGVSFVIHNANPYQRYYEEDILEKRNDIVGHYRIT